MAAIPELDPEAPIQFVINAAAGSSDADTRRKVIERVMHAQRRRGDLHFCDPDGLARVAQESAQRALSAHAAVVAVGGDGTLNAVAQAAHAAGCALGVLVAGVNDRVFLVNASLGLYPELLEDREAYKARFGRSRWVAFVAACSTLLRAQRRLRLHIEMGGTVRDVQALTLFVGNNRLQLQQLGAEPEDTIAGTPGDGSMAAVMLRPIGTLPMIGLMLHGAMGRLGEAAGVERFEFQHMVVKPTLRQGRRGVKVAFDGEVTTMGAPLDFRVLAKPLYLLAPPGRGDGR
jgi:diacylglycerol kinase family enzyme